MKKVLAGTTAEDISRAGGWLQVETGGRPFHIMFEKVGAIRAQVLEASDMVPARAVLVMSLPGPLVFVSPATNEESELIGNIGDWILLYRSGAKELFIRILPGLLEDYRAKELAQFATPEDEEAFYWEGGHPMICTQEEDEELVGPVTVFTEGGHPAL